MVTPPSDLTAKYQKLATEYAKIRAQMGVLKKGLLDEQDKSGRLTDEVHERDMQLRKSQGEMEAVLFRNQQLAKRINVLQDEAEAIQKSKGRSKWSRRDRDRERSTSKERGTSSSLLSVADSAETVINEELVAKITENAELKVKLADIETTYEGTIQALRTRVEDLEREKVELSSGQKLRETEASQAVEDLQQKNLELNNRVETVEREGVEKNDQIVQLQVQLESSVERCEGLEKEAVAVGSLEQGTQYNYVDMEGEEEREVERREKKSLVHRLDSSLSKIRDLEKDREHWKLEYQLIQLKMEKFKEGNYTTSNSLSDTANTELDEVMALREEEIKLVWEAKIEDLIASRLMADSKAVAYFLEMEALTARLTARQREGEKLSREASTARLEEDRVREEIDTTKENYESQLSVMSDHLASMNSKLAEQEETIAQLRYGMDEIYIQSDNTKQPD